MLLHLSTWAEIETHWQCGTKPGRELTEIYGISATALTSHYKRHNIHRNSHSHLVKKAAEEKILGASAAAEDPVAVLFEQKRKGRIAQTRESYMNRTDVLGVRWNTIVKEIIEGARKEAECANDFKALRHAILAAEKIADSRLRILKAEDDVDEAKMPTLIFRDLSQEEISSMANADNDDLDLDLPTAPIALLGEEDEVVEEGVPSPPRSS